VGENEEVLIQDELLVRMGAQDTTFSNFMETNKAGMMQLQERQVFKRKGHKMLDRLEKYKSEQVAEEDIKLISVCSLPSLVLSTDSQRTFSIHFGIQHKRYSGVEALLAELDAMDVLVDQAEVQENGALFSTIQAGLFSTPSRTPEVPETLRSVILAARSLYKTPQ